MKIPLHIHMTSTGEIIGGALALGIGLAVADRVLRPRRRMRRKRNKKNWMLS